MIQTASMIGVQEMNFQGSSLLWSVCQTVEAIHIRMWHVSIHFIQIGGL